MLEAMAEWMGFPMYFAFDGAPPPPRNGAGHATIYPYGPYATADGSVFFGLQNDREWAAFARIVLAAAGPGRRRRASRAMPAAPTIARCSSGHHHRLVLRAHHRRSHRAARACRHRAPRASTTWRHCGRIRSLPRADRWAEFGSPAGPLPALKPVSGDGWEPRLDPVPALGEHTEQILAGIRRRPRHEASEAQGMIPKPDRHQEMREALRELCARISAGISPRRMTQAATYPVEFIDALTKAGWLAAMIPEEYGGSGLGLTEATVVMEEINRSGGNAGHCHGQMYNMGTLLRHGSSGAEGLLSAQDRQRRTCACNRWASPSRRPAPTRPS